MRCVVFSLRFSAVWRVAVAPSIYFGAKRQHADVSASATLAAPRIALQVPDVTTSSQSSVEIDFFCVWQDWLPSSIQQVFLEAALDAGRLDVAAQHVRHVTETFHNTTESASLSSASRSTTSRGGEETLAAEHAIAREDRTDDDDDAWTQFQPAPLDASHVSASQKSNNTPATVPASLLPSASSAAAASAPATLSPLSSSAWLGELVAPFVTWFGRQSASASLHLHSHPVSHDDAASTVHSSLGFLNAAASFDLNAPTLSTALHVPLPVPCVIFPPANRELTFYQSSPPPSPKDICHSRPVFQLALHFSCDRIRPC